jgi:ABC-type amino acid transport substrate-binding protein
MKKNFPHLSRRTFLASTFFVATGLIGSTAFADTLDDIKAKGVLVVGSGVVGSKPWMYKNEDGSYGGMEYEMLQYIIKKLGVPKVEIVDAAWETLIPGLKAKRWDVIFSGMTVTEERRQGAGIEFTRPYYFESDRIVVKGDSPYQKPDDLAGKTLGVPLGTVEEIQAKSLIAKGIGKDIRAFENVATVFQALISGQVDAIIMDNTSLAGQKAVTPDLRTIGGVYNLAADEKWQDAQAKAPYKYGGDGAGVRKEDTNLLNALNEALDAMDSEGAREAIFKKYGVWDDSLSKESMMTK